MASSQRKGVWSERALLGSSLLPQKWLIYRRREMLSKEDEALRPASPERLGKPASDDHDSAPAKFFRRQASFQQISGKGKIWQCPTAAKTGATTQPHQSVSNALSVDF